MFAYSNGLQKPLYRALSSSGCLHGTGGHSTAQQVTLSRPWRHAVQKTYRLTNTSHGSSPLPSLFQGEDLG